MLYCVEKWCGYQLSLLGSWEDQALRLHGWYTLHIFAHIGTRMMESCEIQTLFLLRYTRIHGDRYCWIGRYPGRRVTWKIDLPLERPCSMLVITEITSQAKEDLVSCHYDSVLASVALSSPPDEKTRCFS